MSIFEGRFFVDEIGITTNVETEGDTDGGAAVIEPDEPAPDEPVEPVEPTEPIDPAPDPDEPLVSDEPFQPDGFDGLFVFRADPEGGFTELGRLSTRFEESGFFFSSFTRGVFIGDKVFAVTDTGVRGAPVEDIASAPYELLLGPPDTIFFDEGGFSDSGSTDAASPPTEEATARE